MSDIEDIYARLTPGAGYNSLLDLQTDATSPGELFFGRALGNYKLNEFVAQGGMSQIYLASRSDGFISRQVAIKISPSSGLGADFRDRFLREQQVLASLNHEYISHLYDVGFTEEGFPYIVMEWIEGHPIDEYCQAQGLSVEAKVELLLKVAQAVQFAHAHLVVHRDIKPSNILVDVAGAPKLLDFGIAKLLESHPDGDLTDHLLPMTPDFASPEQLTGGLISTASDIYQLGALLHLLVTRQRLHSGTTQDLVALASENSDLNLPALRDSQLPADLVAIIRKCLRRDPAARYVDVSSLIADMNAYLSGYPVTAARGAQLYRMKKFLMRNRPQVILSLALAVVLIGGSVLYAVNLQTARDLAQRQAQTSGELLSAMSGLIADTYSELIETRSDRVSSGDLGNEPLRLLLERTNRLIDNTLVNETELRAELLRLQGATNRQLSQQDISQAKLDEALVLAQRSEDLVLQIQIFTEMILLHTAFNEFENAQGVVEQAFALTQRLPDDTLQLAALNDAAATLYTRQDRFDDAKRHIEAAISTYEANPRANPIDLAGSYAQLGIINGRLEDVLEQRAWLNKALNIYLLNESPNYRGLNMVYNGIAWSHAVMGEYADAAEYFGKSLTVSRSNFGDNHPTTAAAHSNLGIALRRQGDFEAALEHLNLSLEIARQLDNKEQEVAALLNVGNVYQDLGDLAAAQIAFEDGLQLNDVLEQMPGNKAYFYNNLGSLLLNLGDVTRGMALLRQALEIKQNVFGAQSITSARTMLALVEGQMLADDDTDADKLLAQARSMYVQQYGEGHAMFVHFSLVSGRYALFKNRYEQGQQELSQALTKLEGADPDQSRLQRIHLLHSLTRLNIAKGGLQSAQETFAQAQAVLGSSLPGQPDSAGLMERIEHDLIALEIAGLACTLQLVELNDLVARIDSHFPARQDWRQRVNLARGSCPNS